MAAVSATRPTPVGRAACGKPRFLPVAFVPRPGSGVGRLDRVPRPPSCRYRPVLYPEACSRLAGGSSPAGPTGRPHAERPREKSRGLSLNGAGVSVGGGAGRLLPADQAVLLAESLFRFLPVGSPPSGQRRGDRPPSGLLPLKRRRHRQQAHVPPLPVPPCMALDCSSRG